MAYNTKPIVTDIDGNPISQYYNPTTDIYEPIEGISGANKVVLYNNDGTENDSLSLLPILDKLSQLTGTVIDEEIRKTNELQRIFNEDARILSENSRISNEDVRISEESIRVSSENQRLSDENIRMYNEDVRVTSELTRESNEVIRQNQENVRKTNEQNRTLLYELLQQKLANGDFKGDKGDTGNGLEYNWQGTSLGVRVEGQVDYVYVDLKGETGDISNLNSTHIKTALGYVPANENTLNNHILNIASSSEVHGIRVNLDNEFQFKDNNGEWQTVRGGGGSSVKIGNVSNLTITPLLNKVIKINWTDPADVVLEGITLATWGGTQLRRKTTGYPIDEKDGELVIDSKVRNQFQNGYLDENLVDGQKYYYMLFPYTDDGTFTVDVSNRVEGTAFNKYTQSPPIKPSISGLGSLKVTISSDVGSVVSLNQVDWFPSPHEFTGLIENETYIPYAKFEETLEYSESSTVQGDGFIAINKLPKSPPGPPQISNLDFYKATFTGVSGTEVKLNNGEWFNSPHTFTDLTPETEYRVYARFKETETHFQSDPSEPVVFTTPPEGDDMSGSPGSINLIAGTMEQGYFGVVPASELWTGTQLSSAVGISQGTIQFDDTPWLKFAHEGKILFRPMKAFRHSISWDSINAAGCVFGTKAVTKNGHTYKVRLMKGALTDPSKDSDSDRGAKGSEWNRLMLPIHIQAKDKSWSYPAYVEDDIPYWGIDFTDQDLHTHNTYGNGTYVWCQETPTSGPSHRVYRGGGGVSYSHWATSSSTNTDRGWAPVLEWVSSTLTP